MKNVSDLVPKSLRNIKPTKPSGRRQTLFAVVQHEKAITELMLAGKGELEIVLATGYSQDYVRHVIGRVNKRALRWREEITPAIAKFAAENLIAIAGEHTKLALPERDEAGNVTALHRDAYRYGRTAVDAMHELAQEVGIGNQQGTTNVTVMVNVPVLGPAQRAIAGEVVDGSVLRVIESGDSKPAVERKHQG